jgi:hypothetical protein
VFDLIHRNSCTYIALYPHDFLVEKKHSWEEESVETNEKLIKVVVVLEEGLVFLF